MARNCLGRTGVRSEGQIASKGSHGNRQHDPPIVGHEEKPTELEDPRSVNGYSHDEETVKDLQGIQCALDQRCPSLLLLSASLTSWQQ